MSEPEYVTMNASAKLERGFRVYVNIRSHRIVVDQPQEMGGEDSGPNPTELLAAALASCFIISTKIHGQRLGLHLSDAYTEVHEHFDLRGFLVPEEFETGIAFIDLKARIALEGRCSQLSELFEKVLRGWVVGATIARGCTINVLIEYSCKEGEHSTKGTIRYTLRHGQLYRESL